MTSGEAISNPIARSTENTGAVFCLVKRGIIAVMRCGEEQAKGCRCAGMATKDALMDINRKRGAELGAPGMSRSRRK